MQAAGCFVNAIHCSYSTSKTAACSHATIAVQAKRRVYALKSGRKRSKPNNGKAGTGNLDATLEPLPKWGVLLELLQVSLLKLLANMARALYLHAPVKSACLL